MDLSERTLIIAQSLFGEGDLKMVESRLLERCSNNAPGCNDWSQKNLERVWLAVLKLSNGNLDKLLDAIELANTD